MELGILMLHSQGLFNNPYPVPNQPFLSYWTTISLRSILIMSSHLRLGLPESIFPVDLPVNNLKTLYFPFLLHDLSILIF